MNESKTKLLYKEKMHLKFPSDINSFCVNIAVRWLTLICLFNDNTQFLWRFKISDFSNFLLLSGYSCIHISTAHQATLIFLQQFSASFHAFSILIKCSETIITRMINGGSLRYSSLTLPLFCQLDIPCSSQTFLNEHWARKIWVRNLLWLP